MSEESDIYENGIVQSYNPKNDLFLEEKKEYKCSENDSHLGPDFSSVINCVISGKWLSFASIIIFLQTLYLK